MNRIRLAPSGAVIVLLLTSGSRAAEPSFDCKAALTPVEGSICANDSLKGLDRHLAVEMKAALIRGATGRGNLQSDQRRWLRQRDEACARTADIAVERERAEACLEDAYRLRIAQLKVSPSVCERLVGRLRPFVADGVRDNVPLLQHLAEKPGSGVVVLPTERFVFSRAEWSRRVKLLAGVANVDRDLNDEVARDVSDGQLMAIATVSTSEELYVAELPQGRHSCTQDVYFRVVGGTARRAKDLDVDGGGVDVDDAGVDGDLCRTSRLFGTIDGLPAMMDDGSAPPTLTERLAIRTRVTGPWTPLCTVDIDYAPRLLTPTPVPDVPSSASACSPSTCIGLASAAARLADLAQGKPAQVETTILSTMSSAQKAAYAEMLKSVAEAAKADPACGVRPDEKFAPPVFDGETYLARYGHVGMGCYGIVSSDWTIEFGRLDAGALRSIATYLVKVDRGPATGVRAHWPPGGKS